MRKRPAWIDTSELKMLDWLLLAVPIAFAVRYVPVLKDDTVLFIVSGIAIIPLAGWMGRATEQLASRAGYGLGGLLNATFGNAAELIIALIALSKDLTDVVKASLTGSIIGNTLLVLGGSILAGGLKYPSQTFRKRAARVASTSLVLAAIGLIIPSIFHHAAARQPGGWSLQAEQNLSLAIAIVLFVTYLLWLAFMLVTHKELFAGQPAEHDHDLESDDVAWRVWTSITVLLVSTIVIAVISEFLVSSVESTTRSLGLTEVFVGVIIFAIIGNAAEHSTAVTAALNNKMDLTLNIAIGSSLQIALFVTPVLVFASYLFKQPMSLEFSVPEIVAVALAVWIVAAICSSGETNWLEGVQLLSVYVILGILFLFLPEGRHRESNQAEQSGQLESRASASDPNSTDASLPVP